MPGAGHSPCCDLHPADQPSLSPKRSFRFNLICACGHHEVSRLCLCVSTLPRLCELCYESSHHSHQAVCICALELTDEQSLFQRKETIAQIREIRRRLHLLAIKEIDDAMTAVDVTSKQMVDTLVRESDRMKTKLEHWKQEITNISHSLVLSLFEDAPSPPKNVFEALIAHVELPLIHDYFKPVKIAIAFQSSDVAKTVENLWNRIVSLRYDHPLQPFDPVIEIETCVGCYRRQSSFSKLFHRPIALQCGHLFHSKDCLLEYVTRSSRCFYYTHTVYRCPRCWMTIQEVDVERMLGAGYKRGVKTNRCCCACKAKEDLFKRSQSGHYLCAVCKDTIPLDDSRPCLCQSTSVWLAPPPHSHISD